MLLMSYMTCMTLYWFSGTAHPPPHAELIQRISCQNKVSPRLVASIVMQESGGNSYAIQKERKVGDWSIGLMQIRVDTARELGFKGRSIDLFNPWINLSLGTKYLKSMIEKYGEREGISAYNAGRPCRCNKIYVSMILRRKNGWEKPDFYLGKEITGKQKVPSSRLLSPRSGSLVKISSNPE